MVVRPFSVFVRPHRTQPVKSGHFDKATGQARTMPIRKRTNHHFFEHCTAQHAQPSIHRSNHSPNTLFMSASCERVRKGGGARGDDYKGDSFVVAESQTSRTENQRELNLSAILIYENVYTRFLFLSIIHISLINIFYTYMYIYIYISFLARIYLVIYNFMYTVGLRLDCDIPGRITPRFSLLSTRQYVFTINVYT